MSTLVIDYNPGKANVAADALSLKSSITLAHIRTTYVPLSLDMNTMRISLYYDGYEFTQSLYGSYLKVMD